MLLGRRRGFILFLLSSRDAERSVDSNPLIDELLFEVRDVPVGKLASVTEGTIWLAKWLVNALPSHTEASLGTEPILATLLASLQIDRFGWDSTTPETKVTVEGVRSLACVLAERDETFGRIVGARGPGLKLFGRHNCDVDCRNYLNIDDVPRPAGPPPLTRGPCDGESSADIPQPSIESILGDVRNLAFAPAGILEKSLSPIIQKSRLHHLDATLRPVDTLFPELNHCQGIRRIRNGTVDITDLFP